MLFWLFLLIQIIFASSHIDSDLIRALTISTEEKYLPVVEELRRETKRECMEEKAETLLYSKSKQTRELARLIFDFITVKQTKIGYASLAATGSGDKYKALLLFLVQLRRAGNLAPLLNMAESETRIKLFDDVKRHFELGEEVFKIMSLNAAPLNALLVEVAKIYMVSEKQLLAKLGDLTSSARKNN